MNKDNSLISLSQVLELAKSAKAEKEDWVQISLLVMAATNNMSLAEPVARRLRIQDLIEALDPFPFASPGESDFL